MSEMQRSFADELAAGMGAARASVPTPFPPGSYSDLPMERYLAMPGVSNSIICTLLDECPYAAWFESWLNAPAADEEEEVEEGPAEKAKRRGTIAHQILLEGSDDCCEPIDPQGLSGAEDRQHSEGIHEQRDTEKEHGQ